MLNLAILGCGQIGSRHLQALSLLEEGADIHLLDSSSDSLSVAQNRFEEVLSPEKQGQIRIFPTSDISNFPANLDVAIIASGAAHRAELCKSLLAQSAVSNLMLEKFLFQRFSDFECVGQLLKKTDTRICVNQWMSSVYAFRRIARRLGQGPYTMHVYGSGWGLCCNSPHFLEYFDYLTSRNKLAVSNTQIEAVIDAKRTGFRELLGTLEIQATDGSLLQMECAPGKPSSTVSVKIATADISIEFEFGLSSVECVWSNGLSETLWIPMQSRLTHQYLQAMTLGQDCGLPSYARSSYQHLTLLAPFHAAMSAEDPSIGDRCPIT